RTDEHAAPAQGDRPQVVTVDPPAAGNLAGVGKDVKVPDVPSKMMPATGSPPAAARDTTAQAAIARARGPDTQVQGEQPEKLTGAPLAAGDPARIAQAIRVLDETSEVSPASQPLPAAAAGGTSAAATTAGAPEPDPPPAVAGTGPVAGTAPGPL